VTLTEQAARSTELSVTFVVNADDLFTTSRMAARAEWPMLIGLVSAHAPKHQNHVSR
jgi:hypothetical protein